jgi:succinate dehydrogenase / fumarate reductase cytochrome b subunit
MTELARKRPEFRNINALKDLPTYRLPVAGIASAVS